MGEVFWLVVQHIFMQLLSSCLLTRVMVHGQVDFFCFVTQAYEPLITYFIQKMILCVTIALWSYNQTSKLLLVPCRAVTILDFTYHGYCGFNNSRYRYIAISIEAFGGGGVSFKLFFTVYIEFFFFTKWTKILINAGHKTRSSLELLWNNKRENTVKFNSMTNKY